MHLLELLMDQVTIKAIFSLSENKKRENQSLLM